MSGTILFDQEDGWKSGGRIVLTDLMGMSSYFHLRVDTDHPKGAYLNEGQRKDLIAALQETVKPELASAEPVSAVQEFNVGDRVRLVHDRDDYVGLPVGTLGTVEYGPEAEDSVPALIGRIKAARDLALRMDNDAMVDGLASVLVMLAMFGATE